ncbi:MAG: DUF4114 domain-containing protein [Cyanobium sp.]
MADLGYGIATKTPDPGAIPGGVTSHWRARDVNPNDALLGTYYSVFSAGVNGGSWSEASNLNPSLKLQTTVPSASQPGSLQDALVIGIAPASWLQADAWTLNGSGCLNPARQRLTGITVQLTSTSDPTETTTLNLTPDQVLLGTNSLAALQPRATDSNFRFDVLTDTPAFNLVIDKDQLPHASGTSPLADTYSATYTFNFDGTYGDFKGNSYQLSNTNPVTFNSDAAAAYTIATTGNASDNQFTKLEKHEAVIATAAVIEQAPVQLKYINSGEVLKSSASAAVATDSATSAPANSFGMSQVAGSYIGSNGYKHGWLAIAQPICTNAISNPAGRVWLQYTGQSLNGKPTTDAAQAPTTWLNALARSNFSPESPNLPLLGNATHPSDSGGLLIEADPTTGWDQNFGKTMLVADVNGDGSQDLVIAAPQANGGGKVYIIDGSWIRDNLTNANGVNTINLANANNLGAYVTTLTASAVDTATDIITVAGFGTALAYDTTTSTLLVGAPNYVSQLDPSNTSTSASSLQAIGAVYSYTYTAASKSWSQKNPPILGSGGTMTSLDPSGSPTTSYWGSKLGSAIAVDDKGAIAISAPGVVAAMEYSGTKSVWAQALGEKTPDNGYGDGALLKIQVANADNNFSVSIAKGTNSPGLQPVANQSAAQTNATELTTHLKNVKELLVDRVTGASILYNQALQANAVGAVYLLNQASDLQALSAAASINAQSVAALSSGGATFYGPQVWNTLGESGFGSSLSFGDYNNSNSKAVLAIGASQYGGAGAVYLVNTDNPFTSTDQADWLTAINLGSNQYLANLASSFSLYGAESQDHLGSGLVNLGDVNNDGYDDLLVQAYNASSSAGTGYVLFGSDTLTATTAAGAPNTATASVAPGSIGVVTRADGSTFTTAILTEIGSGLSSYTGQGTFGSGDINGDGFNDILLGSGPNGSAYLTWGQSYLEAINNLQLSKLTSSTGYRLDGLATTTKASLRSIGDFNNDGYDDFISIDPGSAITTVRLQLGANTQEVLADYLYNYYTFTVKNGTKVAPAGDVNGDGFADIALFLNQDGSDISLAKGGSAGILYGRASGDLPIGAGFGLLAPVDASGAPRSSLPGLGVSHGFTDATPTVISVGTTLYAVVKGYGNTHLYFTQSTDAGSTWNSWTDISALTPGLATDSAPSLAFLNNKLYLAFLNTNATPTLSLSSWDPTSQNAAAWSTPTQLSDSLSPGAGFSSSHGPQLIDRGDGLGIVWVDASSGTLYGSYSSFLSAAEADNSWSTPSQLLQRVEVDGSATYSPIAASDAPSLTWLADQAVIAVANGSSVNVYAALTNSLSWELASTFSSAAGEAAISTAPVLASTDTGLALTYGSSDGAINLQRLDLLEANGTLRDANQLWLKTTLNHANSGLSSTLATVPLSVNGTLLLSNVRSDDNAIWLNAIPVRDSANSSTWLNSNVPLPAGNGNAIDSQYSRTTDWQSLAGGSSTFAPAFAELNGVLYAAVRGENDGLWWSSSKDGGQSWEGWQQITNAYSTEYSTTTISPSLAAYDGCVYMSYAYKNTLVTTYFDGYDWSELPAIPQDTNGNYFTVQFASLIVEDGSLSAYYVGDDGNIHRTSSTEPWGPLYSYWQNSLAISDSGGTQASSGNLALARFNNQTYIAYQYGYTTRLTTSADPGTASSWSLFSSGNGVPQPKNPSESGVGLTANNLGLVLSYADEINNEQVVVLQQGTVTASGWSTSSTANVSAPDDSQGVNTSLFSTSGTSAVLLGAINTNANQAITTAFSSLTTTNYGDLNGDGRLDYLAPAGLDSIDTGDKPNFYSVWSIRAAGDVNGNGLDDILLALAANNSDDESIQTVLIDGSLFKISDNTFSLANLRAPLDPYAADNLNIPAADRQSSSNPDNYLPSLQNWIKPILDYIPSTTIRSASLSNATTPIQGYEVANDRYYNWASLSSTVAGDGTIFIVNQGLGSNNIFLAFGDPNNASPHWQQLQIPGASTDSAPSLAFYNQTLYIAYKSPQGASDYNVLNMAYNTTPGDYSSWTTYSLSGQSSSIGPTLVNEGNHLALYFVANDAGSEIISLASTDPTKSSSWGGTYADGAFSGGPMAIADSSGVPQASSSLISATRFQGKTILAYMSGTYRGSVGDQTKYWITEKTDDKTWSAFEIYELDPYFNNVLHNPCIASDASRLYLTTGYKNPIDSYSYVTAGTSYNTWGTPAYLPDTANSIYQTINLASTGSNLYAIWRNSGSSDDLTISPLSLSTDSAVQQSLAGYSIDSDVDVNGDGFRDMLVSDPSDPSLGVDSQYVLLGGDYLDIASQVGTDANDSLIGSPLADVIYTLAGDDVVQSMGGADLIYTGSGSDRIAIKDNSFWRIDAGSGFDQLLLEGLASQSYDFRLNTPSPQYFAGTKLRDIELISSLDYGANTLYFDAAGVNAFNSNRILFLTCDTTDSIVLSNEFKRDTSFDSAYADKIWYAYAANQQGGLSNNAALNGNPALVYVAAPDGTSADTWLSQNVSITSAAAPATQSLQARAFTAAAPAPTAMPTALASSTDLGGGVTLLAYKTTSSSATARFEIRRSNTNKRQVFSYASSSTNATAAPGRDYDAVAGLLALEQGESSRQITVPLASAALEQLRNATLSLEVRELQDCGQKALHLIIKPAGDPAGASAPDPYQAPVFSDFSLTPSSNAAGAILTFRADRNANSSNLSSLSLNVTQRSAADSSDSLATKAITLLDAIDPESSPIPAVHSIPGALALDNDAKTNDQISARLELNFKAEGNTPAVSLAAPELHWSNQVQLLGSTSLKFKQNGPLTSWRADSGPGLVSFGFQSGASSLSLLRDASGGSTGSINASNALSSNPSHGWQTTEGQAIGSRSVVQGLNLVGSSWTPTASRDGQALQLLKLSVEGNQITAQFTGGVIGVVWQAMGSAPTAIPIRPAVEVQRLAGFNNSLAFYAIDSITGEVDGLKPGDAHYLEAALHRAEADGLLLDSSRLPAFGASKSFTDLPIDTNLAYGLLLLQNGDRSTIFSSFAAANPGAAPQMVRLGSEANTMVLGFEDLSTLFSGSDKDFNDIIVSVDNVKVGLF